MITFTVDILESVETMLVRKDSHVISVSLKTNVIEIEMTSFITARYDDPLGVYFMGT